MNLILISNFRLVLNVVFFLLGDSPASDFNVPTLQKHSHFHLHRGCAYTTYADGSDRLFRNVGI